MSTQRRCIVTADAPPPIGPYCQGSIAGPYVFTSETGGVDPKTGQLPPGGIEPQTNQVIDNLQAILRAGGCQLEDVAKVVVYLASLGDFKAMNEVYAQRFAQPFPVRSIVPGPLPDPKALVAMEAIALRP
jgi:2-iminobutanoate/2-iminopropanoate deaminase